jgi:DNA-binding IscR family transcriptional regulator
MIDLAEHNNGEYITLRDIASRQEISWKDCAVKAADTV